MDKLRLFALLMITSFSISAQDMPQQEKLTFSLEAHLTDFIHLKLDEVIQQFNLQHASADFDIKNANQVEQLQCETKPIFKLARSKSNTWRVVAECFNHYLIKMPINVGITLRADAWVSSQRVRKGQVLQVERVNQAIAIRHLPLASFSRIEKSVATQTIIAGETINLQHLQLKYDAKVGQSIQIVAVTNGLKVTSSGVVLEDGRVNQVIKVRNTRSEQIVQGVLVDQHTVMVRIKGE